MKRIGIVGGIGPESTIDYYRLLMAARHTDVTIDSVDVRKLLEWMPRGELDRVADYLSAAVARLAAGGADLAILAANTPHIVFDAVASRAAIPMVSIVEAAAAHVAALGLTRAALLGTRYTMEGQFYPEVFARHGLGLVVPPEPDRSLVHDRYINELLENVLRDETRAELLGVIERLVERERVQAVILGGTELPLILREEAHAGAVLIDTTRVHVQAVLTRSRTLRDAWQSHITAADYDRHMAAVGQAQANAATVERFVRERLRPGARVLVPGAGTGQLLDFVAEGLLEAFDVTFTDVSPQLLAELQARIAGRSFARVSTLVDDIEQTTLQGPYDGAIVVLVLEHTDWRRVIGTLADLGTALCLVVVQRNPRVPVAKPLAGTLAILHDVPFTLVDPDEVGREFAVHGYEMVATEAVDVPDHKQMLALVFGRRHGV